MPFILFLQAKQGRGTRQYKQAKPRERGQKSAFLAKKSQKKALHNAL
jgi:hypothetical protein